MALLTPDVAPLYPPFSDSMMTPRARRRILFRDVDVLIDGGANRGQYALWARDCGFRGRIISFEPSSECFAELALHAQDDDLWECHHLALGPSDGVVDIHLSHSSLGTSVFKPTVEHVRAWPDDVSAGTETVDMRSLASLSDQLDVGGQSVYLKLDVEGSELSVLQGAGPLLDVVTLLELEVCLVGLYEGAPLFGEVARHLSDRGFTAVALEQNGGDDETTGQMLMIDAVFRAPQRSSRGDALSA